MRNNLVVIKMGKGRPRKYDGPVKRFEAWIPYEVYIEMVELKEKKGISWPDLILDMWETYKAKQIT